MDMAEKTKATLGKITIENPTPYGGVFKNPSNAEMNFTEFVSHAPPDVSPDTRVVAVCGATDHDNLAHPNKDGRFFSDFYLFHNLLRGVAGPQTWISSENPTELVSKYGTYLHGNAHKTRKVVLDAEMLDKGKIGPIQTYPRMHLKENFLRIVESESSTARQTGERLLLLLFGHGDKDTHGVALGLGNLRKLKISNLRRVIGGPGVSVTLLSTSCYSGGWSTTPELNISTMTAAGPENEGISWPVSASLDRACGSMWSSAVVLVLLQEANRTRSSPESTDTDEILPNEPTERQEHTFNAFCSAIWNRLFSKVDRMAIMHNITFAAQDDDWESFWAHRAGFPLADYETRFNALVDYSAGLENPLVNRDVEMYNSINEQAMKTLLADGTNPPRHVAGSENPTPQNPEADAILQGNNKRKRHEEEHAFQRIVQEMAEGYLASCPGADNLGPNVAIHSWAKECRDGLDYNYKSLQALFIILSYRLSLVKLADRFVELVCQSPNGLSCGEWEDDTAWERLGTKRKAYDDLRGRIYRMSLFPPPNQEQGPSWAKPDKYLAAAMTLGCADDAEIEKGLRKLESVKHKILDELCHDLLRDPDVRSKRRKVAEALGRGLRKVSR
ncbi:hypothetical protein GX50_05165 [[Emmonsia] crescens]|uniref:Uncharacterized protein n=1 Tax=[Emmonsia] crescens TaxID=73230 RepID=A0A2B7ZFB1_9EURO|nr:hypothetical protein GX50_05165 [Emmonsia crescens]